MRIVSFFSSYVLPCRCVQASLGVLKDRLFHAQHPSHLTASTAPPPFPFPRFDVLAQPAAQKQVCCPVICYERDGGEQIPKLKPNTNPNSNPKPKTWTRNPKSEPDTRNPNPKYWVSWLSFGVKQAWIRGAMKSALELVILCTKRWLKIEMTARQAYFRGIHGTVKRVVSCCFARFSSGAATDVWIWGPTATGGQFPAATANTGSQNLTDTRPSPRSSKCSILYSLKLCVRTFPWVGQIQSIGSF